MTVECIERVCRKLADGDTDKARRLLAEEMPVSARPTRARNYTEVEMLRLFRRDSFTCRYTGNRLILGAALKLISAQCPEQFPYDSHWRIGACHQAYWDFTATLDHVEAWSRSGPDSEDNWVTTSMTLNMQMGNGAGRLPGPISDSQWDGMARWFADFSDRNDVLLGSRNSSLRVWRRAVRTVYGF